MSGADISLQDIRESQPGDPVVIMMGKTGSGKSSFVRELVDADQGSTIKVGDLIESCTQESKRYEVKLDTATVQVMDTPGLSDTFRTDEEIMKDIVTFYVALHGLGFRLKGFLYLIEITGKVRFTSSCKFKETLRDMKVTNPEMKHLTMMRKLCGDDALKNIVFATTKWENYWDDERLAARWSSQTLLHSVRYLGNFVRNGADIYRYEGTKESAKSLLRALVAKEDAEFKIVKEIKSGTETSLYEAGLGMLPRRNTANSMNSFSSVEGNFTNTRPDQDAPGDDAVFGEFDPRNPFIRRAVQDAQDFLEEAKNEAVREHMNGRPTGNHRWTPQELAELAKKIFDRVIKSGKHIFGFVARASDVAANIDTIVN